jgi:hypothetical protein
VYLRGNETVTFYGNLNGYFRGDSLIKITNWDAHVSVWQHDYYFQNGNLIFVSITKREPIYDSTNQNEMEVVFQDKYFIDNRKIIKKEFIGRRSKRDRKHDAKHIYENALEFKKQLLIARTKNDS